MCQSIVKKIAVKFKQSNKNCSSGRGKTLKILPDCGSAVHTAPHQRDPLIHVYGTRRRVLSLHDFVAAASSVECFWVTEDVNEFLWNASRGSKAPAADRHTAASSPRGWWASRASQGKGYPSTLRGYRFSYSTLHYPGQAKTWAQPVRYLELLTTGQAPPWAGDCSKLAKRENTGDRQSLRGQNLQGGEGNSLNRKHTFTVVFNPFFFCFRSSKTEYKGKIFVKIFPQQYRQEPGSSAKPSPGLSLLYYVLSNIAIYEGTQVWCNSENTPVSTQVAQRHLTPCLTFLRSWWKHWRGKLLVWILIWICTLVIAKATLPDCQHR